MIDIDIGS